MTDSADWRDPSCGEDGVRVPHALASFIRERMDDRGLRNRDVERLSGLSRQLVSKYANDQRDRLTRLPERTTLAGLAKALSVSPEFLLSKAVEALGLGYSSGDFVNGVASATSDELLDELRSRLQQQGTVVRGSWGSGKTTSAAARVESQEAVAADEQAHPIEEEQGHDEHA